MGEVAAAPLYLGLKRAFNQPRRGQIVVVNHQRGIVLGCAGCQVVLLPGDVALIFGRVQLGRGAVAVGAALPLAVTALSYGLGKFLMGAVSDRSAAIDAAINEVAQRLH